MSQRDNQVQSWTISRVLKWTAEYFATNGIDSPRLTAELLLSHVLKIERLDLYLRFDQPLNGLEREGFREAIRRRIQREPVAYITGEKSFWTLDLAVDPAVLIPRPDTETLVESALDLIGEEAAVSVLDLGTGTGCIGLAIAAEREQAFVVAVDASDAACRVARKNVAAAGLSGRMSVVNGNWCDPVMPGSGFDLVVSNPPYIPSEDILALSPEVRDHEPLSALDGGADGLSCYRILVETVAAVLRCGGWLVMEIGFDQKEAVTNLARNTGFYDRFEAKKDLGGQDRVVCFRRGTGAGNAFPDNGN